MTILYWIPAFAGMTWNAGIDCKGESVEGIGYGCFWVFEAVKNEVGFMKELAKVIKYATPIAGATAGAYAGPIVAAMGGGYAKRIAGELKLMEEFAGLLKEYRGGELLDRVGESEYPISNTE